MKNTVGIICEYDPFHRGHARQFALIRERLPGATIICLMSGCFTQRGMPALFSPAFRAEAALKAGAAMVLELPCACAVRDAEHFALGGVSILSRLSFVTHLSFGTETPDLPLLQRVAALLENPNEPFREALRQSLASGKPFAAAQGNGIAAALCMPGATECFAQPNNILAVCYLRALERLHSGLTPLPVKREGDFHNTSLCAESYPSASAVRKAYLSGRISDAEAACGYPLQCAAAHKPDALDSVLLDTVRSMTPEALAQLPDCSEGLENRLKKHAAGAVSRAELVNQMKTKRYIHTRLNRLLTHAMLGMRAELLSAAPLPPYVRLLGFRKEYEHTLAALKDACIPVIAKASDGDKANPLYQLDERAYDLWALGAKLPAGLMYRQRIVIV